MNLTRRKLDLIGAGVVLLVTQIVYLLTMNRSCPFWDSGEFIATSYILGIPHPPGTPLYVLIGRIFTLLPVFGDIASRVNWLSALASSLGAVFAFLVTSEIVRVWRRAASGAAPRMAAEDERAGIDGYAWCGFFGGLVAALFTAFSRTYWDNAIEAEVYSLSSFLMMMAAWMVLRWARTEGAHGVRNGWFLLLYYLICLSMGIHLGTFLVLPGIVLFMLLWDRSSFGGSVVSAWAVAGIVVLLHPGMLPTLGLKIWAPLLLGVLVWSALRPAMMPGERSAFGPRGLVSWCALAAILGMSTHFYLMIRASLNPAINEADPETWSALWKVLTRDQYKPANPFLERQAPWSIQFTKHFWDYARDQFSLGIRPLAVGWYLPYLLGLWGLVASFRREKKTAALLGVSCLIMSLGMVFYLNFKDDEVRDRDYFFVAAFQFFAVWVGLGVASILASVRAPEEATSPGTGDAPAPARGEIARSLPPMFALLGLLFTALPFLTMRTYWFTHDRSKFFVARDYAYNMLQPLEPNAILFTNGDNDTFPLWYLQFVEKVRTDVIVANLSLLNTNWYIKQLKNEHGLEFGWTDEQIDKLHPYLDRNDQIVMVKDLAAARLIEYEQARRPMHLAVTVPDQLGLENRLEMKGLSFAILESKPGGERIDVEATTRNLRDVFLYRGLLRADGTYDDEVYKDENARRLTQNYAAGWLRAAEEYLNQGLDDQAMEAVQQASKISPRSETVQYSLGVLLLRSGRFPEAEELLAKVANAGSTDPRIHRMLGRSLEGQGKEEQAEVAYRRAYELDPTDFDAMREVFSYLWDSRARYGDALRVLDQWVAQNPNDPVTADIARVRQDYADSLSRKGISLQ
ncbi:MAG: DUF2723 domain-containing protein [Candidatus Eisenbacteria bacterium]|nr:DUF2723 domain-containing protein [Candidatus Eisenbacteria bacterium]